MEGYVRLIEVASVPEGEARCVQVAEREPLVVYQVEGRFYATQDLCSHGSASLSQGWIEGHDIVCPVHEGRFDIRDGRALSFPASEPIKSFAVEIRDGAVWADIAAARRTSVTP
jgi:naphthalene 1,2-dioxygenase system ferredoxin subunit